ncbi:MAG: hypothetical protein ACR2N3_04450 [Pyrinomonadaceae bacterium]
MKIDKKLIGTLMISALTITLIGIFAFRQEAQISQQYQDDPPTPVQPGVMTEKQKKHSRIFPSARGNRKLIQQSGNVEEIITVHSSSNFSGRTPPTRAGYFQRLACQSDSVVIARVIGKDSQLTENQDFVFTDYELEVGQVLKNNSNLDIQALKNITLTVLGGAVTIGNRHIKLTLTRKFPLHVAGEYLLFLKYVPDAESYRLISERGIFSVLNNQIITPEDPSIISPDSVESTTALIRGVANNCSNTGGQQ